MAPLPEDVWWEDGVRGELPALFIDDVLLLRMDDMPLLRMEELLLLTVAPLVRRDDVDGRMLVFRTLEELLTVDDFSTGDAVEKRVPALVVVLTDDVPIFMLWPVVRDVPNEPPVLLTEPEDGLADLRVVVSDERIPLNEPPVLLLPVLGRAEVL